MAELEVGNFFFYPPSLGFEPLEPYSTTVGALGNHAFRLPSTTREAVQFELFIVISCAADEIKSREKIPELALEPASVGSVIGCLTVRLVELL